MVHAGGTERQKSREEVGLEVEVRGGAGGGGGDPAAWHPKGKLSVTRGTLA